MPNDSTPTIVIAPEHIETILARVLRAILPDVLAGMHREPSDWLDSKGAAALIGVAPRSVQKLARRSGLPSHRIGPKLLRYRRSEVLAWLEQRSGT